MPQSQFNLGIDREHHKHIVTVLLQDYFHRGVFKQVIGEKQWSRFEGRLEKDTDDVCNLLDRFNIKATFFALGWIGEMYPEIIRKIVNEGHEIASSGYWARSVRDMTPDQFREDILRSKHALEEAGSNKIIGFRCAYQWLRPRDLWALDILAEEGFVYDASFRPSLFRTRANSHCRFLHMCKTNHGDIWEFPTSTSSVLGFNIPVSGGNYLRQFPQSFMLYCFEKWNKEIEAPFVLYFHPWELDTQIPKISAVGPISRIRQYRNLGKIERVLPLYFKQGHFQSISQYLDLSLEYPTVQRPSSAEETSKAEVFEDIELTTPSKQPKHEVSIIIPCFNEESSLPYLKRALDELIIEARKKYELKFIFVDDCSKDDTYAYLMNNFGQRKDCRIIKHQDNIGVAGALQTGMREADTEIVCSIDADCSYDPLELLKMIPLLEPGVDMVTASPYHAEGFVLGVPKWRLFLSRSLSKIYHFFLNNKLSTYTSCFRVYRWSPILNIENKFSDFRGIIELLARLDLQGKVIREFPTTLQCRIFGQSKMNVLMTIFGHLKLLIKIMKYRLRTWKQ